MVILFLGYFQHTLLVLLKMIFFFQISLNDILKYKYVYMHQKDHGVIQLWLKIKVFWLKISLHESYRAVISCLLGTGFLERAHSCWCTVARDIRCAMLSGTLPLHYPKGKVVMTFWGWKLSAKWTNRNERRQCLYQIFV